MRRMIPQNYQEWIKKIKDYVIQNENTTEIGGNLEADGSVKANVDVMVGRDILVDGKSHIKDLNGNPIDFGGGSSETYELIDEVEITSETRTQSYSKTFSVPYKKVIVGVSSINSLLDGNGLCVFYKGSAAFASLTINKMCKVQTDPKITIIDANVAKGVCDIKGETAGSAPVYFNYPTTNDMLTNQIDKFEITLQGANAYFEVGTIIKVYGVRK